MIKHALGCVLLLMAPLAAQATDYTYSGTVYIPESIDVGPASVYPIEFIVTDAGPIADINISLNGLNHSLFGDIVAGLRAPDGTSVYFLGGAGINGGNYAAGGSYVFDTQAAAAIAEYADPQYIAPGSYRESVYRTDGLAGNPDPFGFGTYTISLSAFNGHAATGVWQLFVLDQYDGDKGAMTGSTLSVATAAVPEPASWAMMLLGLGATGGMLRRSRHPKVDARPVRVG